VPLVGDFAFGLGVGERAVKIERLSVADVFHYEVVDVEVERIFTSFFGEDDERRVVANDFVEDDARNSRGLSGRRRRGVGVAGRNGDDQILNENALDVTRDMDYAEYAEIEGEADDLD